MSLNVRNRRVKGLANLRTMAGRMDYLAQSYKMYLRVAILEIEKAHRSVEHLHIESRGELLTRRFNEIDAEKRRLFEAMSTRDTTLEELRPARQERLNQAARQAAAKAEQQRKASEKPRQPRIVEAEEQRRRETAAVRKRGPRQLGQGFRLQY